MVFFIQLLLVLSSCVPPKPNNFHKQILSFPGGRDVYLVINVKAADSSACVGVMCSDLLGYMLKERQCTSLAEFQSIALNKLSRGEPFDFSGQIRDYYFEPVYKCTGTIISSKEKIASFFNAKHVVKSGFQTQWPCIVRDLYQLRIATAVDDESGQLIYLTQEDMRKEAEFYSRGK